MPTNRISQDHVIIGKHNSRAQQPRLVNDRNVKRDDLQRRLAQSGVVFRLPLILEAQRRGLRYMIGVRSVLQQYTKIRSAKALQTILNIAFCAWQPKLATWCKSVGFVEVDHGLLLLLVISSRGAWY